MWNQDDIGELSDSERRIVDAISFRMSSLREDLMMKLNEKDHVIQKLNDEVFTLKAIVSRLENKIDDNDSYERRDTLLFSGNDMPMYSNNEDTSQIISTLLKNKLKLSLPADSISVSHRLGSPPKRGEDRRKVIAKFCRRDTKVDILKAAKTVKPQNLFINESLTPTRSTVHFVLRKARKKFPSKISGISTLDGNIVVYIPPKGPALRNNVRDARVSINTKAKLEKFCNDELSVSITSLFDGDWPN